MNTRLRDAAGTANDTAPTTTGDVRPRSLLSPGMIPGQQVRQVLNLDEFDSPSDPPRTMGPNIDDDNATPPGVSPPLHPSRAAHRPLATTSPTHDKSALASAALATMQHETAPGLIAALAWQRDVAGETAKQKVFHRDAMLQADLTVFAFMRSHSPYIHLLHSASTFAALGGDADYKGKDIGFLGDKTQTTAPLPVILPSDIWKWTSKPASLDTLAMEHYYSTPANAAKLWQPPAPPEARNPKVPRVLFLPVPFVAFCATNRRTPFQLFQFIAEYTTTSSAITIQDCQLCLDWCMVAAHPSDQETTTNSSLAITFEAAISTDDAFHRWTQRRLTSTLGEAEPRHNATTHPHA